jgi:hypothetical protein
MTEDRIAAIRARLAEDGYGPNSIGAACGDIAYLLAELDKARAGVVTDEGLNNLAREAWDEGYYASENTPNPYRTKEDQ